MARKINKYERDESLGKCCECMNSYDPCELDVNGVPFLCHCKEHNENRPNFHFLRNRCDNGKFVRKI